MNIVNKIKKNVSLSDFSTFKIGGQAKYLVEIETLTDLQEIFQWIKENKIDWFLISGGSNVLINDAGYSGIVIVAKNKDLKLKGERIECGAGLDLSRIVTLATSEQLSGMEWAAGIPGSVGGAIRGNAGAYGGAMSDVIELVQAYNIKKNSLEIFSNKDCNFDYRESIFKNPSLQKSYIIWGATIKLVKGNLAEIQNKIFQYIEKRKSNQPNLPSAGCVFKNIIANDLRDMNIDLYKRALNEKKIKGGKVPTAWVIDLLDVKGKKIGGAKISLEHANFIVNSGKATSEDVVMMISYLKQQVRSKYKIQLQEEIEYLGF